MEGVEGGEVVIRVYCVREEQIQRKMLIKLTNK